MIINIYIIGRSTSLVFIIVVFGLLSGGADKVHNHRVRLLHDENRPCFICPGNSIISLTEECQKMQNQTNCAVVMPMPIVRQCKEHHRKYADHQIAVHVVRGPQPGSILIEGQHRVVVRVDYNKLNGKNINKNNTTGLQIKLQKNLIHHQKAAYCRFNLHVIASHKETLRRKDSENPLKEIPGRDILWNNNLENSNAIMLAEFHFHIGQGAHTSTFVKSGQNSSWCDDEEVVRYISEVALSGLVRRNPSVCSNGRTNCSFIRSECLPNSPSNNLILDDDYGLSSDLLELKWKIMTDYFPLMGEDYVYEGADVPEGEMLIDQIQTDTENLFINDPSFSQEIKTAGGRLLNRSFKLGLLDLVCPFTGYILNPSSNKCEKDKERKFEDTNSSVKFIDTISYKNTVKTKPSIDNQRLNNLVASENENTNKFEQSTIAIRSFIPKEKSSKSKNTFKTLFMANPYPKQSILSQLKRPGQYSFVVERLEQEQQKNNSKINVLFSNSTEDRHSVCIPNPCLAGGKCIVMSNDNGFKCVCPTTSRGKRCESLQCPIFYCFNGGTCRVTANLTTSSSNVFPLLSCICPKDFRGTRCQHKLRRGDITSSKDITSNKKIEDSLPGKTRINSEKSNCILNPCRNGGRCAYLQNSLPPTGTPFTCLCPKPYLGKQCDFISCPASAGRRICSITVNNGSNRKVANRVGKQRQLQCLIQTSTRKQICQQPERITFTSF